MIHLTPFHLIMMWKISRYTSFFMGDEIFNFLVYSCLWVSLCLIQIKPQLQNKNAYILFYPIQIFAIKSFYHVILVNQGTGLRGLDKLT